MAAIGAVAGYFTYQQKKLCFKSRQGNSLTEADLNNDLRLTACLWNSPALESACLHFRIAPLYVGHMRDGRGRLCVHVPLRGQRPLYESQQTQLCLPECVANYMQLVRILGTSTAESAEFSFTVNMQPCSPAALRQSQTDGLYTPSQLNPHSCCVRDVASEVAPLIAY